MRGKAGVVHVHKHFIRITPAYAGKSTTWYRPDIAAKDHPRLCGEKTRGVALRLTVPGSPPPMRGKAKSAAYCFGVSGITPAYAGKSTWKYMPFVTSQDHPRLCGEKSQTTLHDFAEKGSPPPMRGKAWHRLP